MTQNSTFKEPGSSVPDILCGRKQERACEHDADFRFSGPKIPRGFRVAFLVVFFLAASFHVMGQSKMKINGTVVDKNQKALPGVTIVVKDQMIGTTSDTYGRFELMVPSNGSIVFSFIGLVSQEIPASRLVNATIKLEESAESLDDVVVIGYGTSRKRDVSGAISSVSGSSVTDGRVVTSVANALQGKVAGMRIASADGAPGAAFNINIRGNTSFNSSSSPLYVIDGMVTDIMNVSPGEIETIDVLKDASSTAIYGSRGANGVVVITTKSGRKNHVSVDLYAMYGVQKFVRKLKLMNTKEFVEKGYFWNLVYAPASTAGQLTYDTENVKYYQDPYGGIYFIDKKIDYVNQYYGTDPTEPMYDTDWQDAVTQTAAIQNYRVNVNGGGDKNTYSLMFEYMSQDGIIKRSMNEKYNLRYNARQELGKKIVMHLNASYSNTYQNGFGSHLIQNAIEQSPMRSPNFTREDLLPHETQPSVVEVNPLTIMNSVTNRKQNKDFSIANAYELKLFPNVTIYLNGSYYRANDGEQEYYPSTVDWNRADTKKGTASIVNRQFERISSDNFIQYSKLFKDRHNVEVMVGMAVSSEQNKWLKTKNANFSIEDLADGGIAEGTVPEQPEYNESKQNMLSYFARVNYTYRDKYIFKATFRGDGASVFAKNNKWGYFPSAAVAWRMNEEPWLKDVSFFDNVKWRLSWGITGKKAIGAYESLSMVKATNLTTHDGSTNVSASYFDQLGNDNLKWETTEEWDIGLDLDFAKNKVGLSVDYFNRVTRDLLYRNDIPQYTGYSTQITNIGKIRNKGLEISLRATPVRRAVVWDFNFNISTVRSKILSLGLKDDKKISAGWLSGNQGYLQVGKPIGNWYGLKTDGIWQTQAEIDEAIGAGRLQASERTQPGDVRYVDYYPDGKTTADDCQILGNGVPDWTGGMTNNISFKGFTLSFMFQFSIGNDVFNAQRYKMESGVDRGNGLKETVDRWKPTLYYYDPITQTRGDLFMEGNASNRYPRAHGQKTVPEMPIDLWIEDASFLRLSDITLTYALPERWLAKAGIKSVKLFVTASNVYVWTKYTGFDPEVNGSSGTASFLMPGMDWGNYPRARTISVGANLTF